VAARRENVQKRYLIHVAGYNLELMIRLLTRAGTPRELQARAAAWLCVVIAPDEAPVMLFVVAINDQIAVLAATLQIDPFG
jgi:transposase